MMSVAPLWWRALSAQENCSTYQNTRCIYVAAVFCGLSGKLCKISIPRLAYVLKNSSTSLGLLDSIAKTYFVTFVAAPEIYAADGLASATIRQPSSKP